MTCVQPLCPRGGVRLALPPTLFFLGLRLAYPVLRLTVVDHAFVMCGNLVKMLDGNIVDGVNLARVLNIDGRRGRRLNHLNHLNCIGPVHFPKIALLPFSIRVWVGACACVLLILLLYHYYYYYY